MSESDWIEYKCKSGQPIFLCNKVTGVHKWPPGYYDVSDCLFQSSNKHDFINCIQSSHNVTLDSLNKVHCIINILENVFLAIGKNLKFTTNFDCRVLFAIIISSYCIYLCT